MIDFKSEVKVVNRVQIKPEVNSGVVRPNLYKEDFLVESGWEIHSFVYRAPRGENKSVKLKINIMNEEKRMDSEVIEFSYAYSNVEKVILALNDPQSFKLASNLMSTYAPERITRGQIIAKYPFTKIEKVNYKKPVELSRTATLDLVFSIDGISYPYSSEVEFPISKYRHIFNNISLDAFEITMGIDKNDVVFVDNVDFFIKTKNITVYESEILEIKSSKVFKVALHIMGVSETKVIIAESKPLKDKRKLNDFITSHIKTLRASEGAPRELTIEELIVSSPSWIQIESVEWMNSGVLNSSSGEYAITVRNQTNSIIKHVEVDFEKPIDFSFVGDMKPKDFVVDDRFLLYPKPTIPLEAISTYFKEDTLPIVVENFKITGANIEPKYMKGFNSSVKIIGYDFEVKLGDLKRTYRKDIIFKYSKFEYALEQIKDSKRFITSVPDILSDENLIHKYYKIFSNDIDLREVDVYPILKSKEIKAISFKEVVTNLDYKIEKIMLRKFEMDASEPIIYDFIFTVSGSNALFKKEFLVGEKVLAEYGAKSLDESNISLANPEILNARRPSHYPRELFLVPRGVEIINIEATNYKDDPRKASVEFVVKTKKGVNAFSKEFIFASETSSVTAENQLFLDTIDINLLTVFLDIDGAPPFEITSSMFSGIPKEVSIKIEYEWPKPLVSDIVLPLVMSLGDAKRVIEIPLSFAMPMTKKLLKDYRKQAKLINSEGDAHE